MNELIGWSGHPSRCGCEKPACAVPVKPCRPPRSMPQLVCCGQETVRCAPVRLCVTGLACACPPYALVSLETAPAGATVCVKEHGICGAIAEVTIPLIACVRDGNCKLHRGCTELIVCVRLSHPCACPPGCLLANADIRLIDACPATCEPIFDAQVAAHAEVLMVRLERCSFPDCSPFFGKPFFPQPHHHGFF